MESKPSEIPDWSGVVVGGTGGNEFLFLTNLDCMALRKIGVSVGTDKADAICVQASCFSEITFGIKKTNPWQEFKFEGGDRFRSLTLWPNKSGNRLGGLEFTIARANGQQLKFNAKCSTCYLGNPVCVDVRSGICWGVKGRSGDDVDAFGFIFKK